MQFSSMGVLQNLTERAREQTVVLSIEVGQAGVGLEVEGSQELGLWERVQLEQLGVLAFSPWCEQAQQRQGEDYHEHGGRMA